MSDGEEFADRTDPFRRELLTHCYRMLGSVHDAEDLVQETLLRAWRSFDDFDDRRGSMRSWLYRIATNACLTALEHSSRRPLPSGLGSPSDDPEGPVVKERPEFRWLQPIPDALHGLPAGDPATIVASRDSVRLAFIVALQHLAPRQRAVLVLRDVLAWRAAEVASLLGTTTAAVNSALQRARAQLAEVSPVEDEVTEPAEPERQELLKQYVTAFENADVTALTRMLREDAVLEMPPYLTWFGGRDAIGAFLASRVLTARDTWRMVPVGANNQPAFALYRRDSAGVHHAHAVQVLTLAGPSIAHIVTFQDPSLFETFGLPRTQSVRALDA
jgi:RNA polymerase sigma-70 factor (ECF subfamily)